MRITFKLNGLDTFKEQIDQLTSDKAEALRDLIAETALEIAAKAKENVADNGSVKTGALIKSIIATGGDFRWTVTVGAPYASDVEYGTAAHEIVPKAGHGVLAFMIDGEWVYVKRVHHPGTHARPFFNPAVEAERPIYDSKLKDLFNS